MIGDRTVPDRSKRDNRALDHPARSVDLSLQTANRVLHDFQGFLRFAMRAGNRRHPLLREERKERLTHGGAFGGVFPPLA